MTICSVSALVFRPFDKNQITGWPLTSSTSPRGTGVTAGLKGVGVMGRGGTRMVKRRPTGAMTLHDVVGEVT